MLNNFPSEWSLFKLNDLGDFKNGANFNRSQFGPGLPVINVKQLYQGRYVSIENLEEIKPDAISNPENLAVKKGDLLFARSSLMASGTGQVSMVNNFSPNTIFSGFIIRFRLTDHKRAIPLYLNYLLRSPVFREQLVRIGDGTTITNLTQRTLGELDIVLPLPSEQQAIVHILGSLDDKIELNRKMNETLETMARAIFKNLFLESTKKVLPKGWRMGKLSDLCTTQYGFTASATDEPVGPKFLRVTDINKLNWIEWNSVPYCNVLQEEEKLKYALNVGDIVVARMADPGKSAIVEQEIDAVFASYLVRLKTESLAHAYYVYGFLKSQAYTEYSEGATGGSVQANMNAKVIVGAELPIPPASEMKAYMEKILPLRKRIVSNLNESSLIATIRDTLLPKLISGQIWVKDAEKLVEEVV